MCFHVVRLSFHHFRLGGSCYSPTTRIRLICNPQQQKDIYETIS
nr:MAG TPA: hypothetical protein [Caudoviricetes sp.]